MRLRLLLLCAFGAFGAFACRSAPIAPRVGSAGSNSSSEAKLAAGAPEASSLRAPPSAAQGGSAPAPGAATQAPRDKAAAAAGHAAGHAAGVPTAADAAPIQDPDVRALLDQYYLDYAAGNGAALAGHFWPDATLATIRSRAFGEGSSVVVMRVDDYVRQHMGDGARATPLRIALEPPRIETIGSVAIAVTHYRAVDPSGHEAQSWQGADLFSLVRHDGSWRIASLVFEGARFGR